MSPLLTHTLVGAVVHVTADMGFKSAKDATVKILPDHEVLFLTDEPKLVVDFGENSPIRSGKRHASEGNGVVRPGQLKELEWIRRNGRKVEGGWAFKFSLELTGQDKKRRVVDPGLVVEDPPRMRPDDVTTDTWSA